GSRLRELFPKPCVAGSNPAGGTRQNVDRYDCWASDWGQHEVTGRKKEALPEYRGRWLGVDCQLLPLRILSTFPFTLVASLMNFWASCRRARAEASPSAITAEARPWIACICCSYWCRSIRSSWACRFALCMATATPIRIARYTRVRVVPAEMNSRLVSVPRRPGFSRT